MLLTKLQYLNVFLNIFAGRWHCDICTICTNCGTKNQEGHPDPSLTQQQRQELSMIANWQHTYQKNSLTKIEEHISTLCVPCVRLTLKSIIKEQSTGENNANKLVTLEKLIHSPATNN